MTKKQTLYLTLCEQLAPFWQQDEHLMEKNSAAWQLVRDIDDWLLLYKDNDRVSPEQFARNCERLRSIYQPEQGKAVA